MRFKIKSLLLLTLLLAILIAFFVKPYTAAVAERNAIKALEKHWQILVDGNAALGKASWSPKPIDDGDQGAWYHWPATLIAGEESLKRLQYLRLVKPLGKELSLKPLSTMDKVSHLTFNLSRHQLSDSDCRCIGRMSSLVSLEISCQASGGFEGWQRLPLKRLVIRGPDWEQEDFDAIGNIATLQFLQLDTTKITRENLGSLSKLKHLKTMCLVSSRKKEGIAGLDQLQSMPNLKSLTLIGDVAANEIDALSTNNNLDSISFYGGSPNDRIVRKLINNKNLKHATFDHMQISVETYDTLVNAGIEVEHYGLTGDELTENFFQYNQIYFPVDFEKSALIADVKPDSKSVTWTIDLSAAKKPRHSALYPPNLDHYGFSFASDWRKLVGFKSVMKTEDWYDESGNFYDGIHMRTNDHVVEFVSRDANRFRMKWNCRVGDTPDDAIDCSIDTQIRFKQVIVQNYDKSITLEAAKSAVAKFFDLNDFSEPVFAGRNNVLILFKVKQTIN